MASDSKGDQIIGRTFERHVYQSQLGRDSRAFASVYCDQHDSNDLRADVAESFLCGASRTLKYFDDFKRRIESEIDPNKASDWDRGQLEGIRWVSDYLRNLFNL